MNDKDIILENLSNIIEGVTDSRQSIVDNIRRIAAVKTHEHFREIAIPALLYLAKEMDVQLDNPSLALEEAIRYESFINGVDNE